MTSWCSSTPRVTPTTSPPARSARFLLAGALFGGTGTGCAIKEAAGWRIVPQAEAADAAETLVRAVVTTPLRRCSTIAGHFTIELEPPYKGAPVLVLTPGYASGSALWAPCLDGLAAHYHVFAVDWLGTGASEKPKWSAVSVADGEAFFIDGLRAWAKAALLPPKFTLAGHSLGGYLSAAYTLSHPEQIDHLILIGSAGIPEHPDSRLAQWRESSWVVSVIGKAWEGGVTPGSLFRTLGPWGASFIKNAVALRFGGGAKQQTQTSPSANTGSPNSTNSAIPLALLAPYIHAIMGGQASGEHALSVLLSFGAHAKEPVGPRLLTASKKAGPPLPPVTLIYGKNDWMDGHAGMSLANNLRAQRNDAVCVIIPSAGHYVFLENPSTFVEVMHGRAGVVKS